MNRRRRAQRRPIPAPVIGVSAIAMVRSGDAGRAPYNHPLALRTCRLLPHPMLTPGPPHPYDTLWQYSRATSDALYHAHVPRLRSPAPPPDPRRELRRDHLHAPRS